MYTSLKWKNIEVLVATFLQEKNVVNFIVGEISIHMFADGSIIVL